MDGTLTGQGNSELISQFWQQWQKHQDTLYRCCLKLMNFNPTDAEDALSQAMLKAWEKVQKDTVKIDNLKAWLFKLTSNLCIDITRQLSKRAAGVESLEWVGATDRVDTASAVDTPEKALEKAEQASAIKQAIASLPERLHETFRLHYYQQLSHKEIASEQEISYENVCKRICLARKHLKQQLSGYFRGTDGDVRGTSEQGKRSSCQGQRSREQEEKRETGETRELKENLENLDLEMSTVLVEQESVEAMEAEIPESVEGFVEPRVVADLDIQETGIVADDRVYVEGVEAEKQEAVESSVLLGVREEQNISYEPRQSGDNKLISLARVVFSRGKEQVTGRGRKGEYGQPSGS
ncbi:MAG: sigma-70 family RNA polymerase sigma factor [Trichodesmium sp. St19_bin1]|nr:sigma-70 family RNA polymerase sigma factor [Trichodesmium sp. St19_bin1]